MKNLIKILTLLVILFLASCQAENDVTINSENNNAKISEKTFEELKSNLKFNSLFNKIPKPSIGLTESKSALELLYNFTIDNKPAKIIENNSITSFTLLIKRDNQTSSYFENLVLQVNNVTNEQKAYIMKYTPTEMLPSANNSFTFKGYTQKIEIPLTKSNNTTQSLDTCTIDVLMCNESWTGGVGEAHPAGSQCRNINYMYVKTVEVLCADNLGSNGGTSGSNTGGSTGNPVDWGNPNGQNNGSGDSTSTPNSNGDSDSGSVITSPVFPTLDISANQIKSINFYRDLSPNQKQWVNANREIFHLLISFQIQKNWSPESTIIANEAMNHIQNLSFDESDYPGKNDNMPFEWWKNPDYIIDNLQIVTDSNTTAETPNLLEVFYFSQYPVQAIKHVANSLTSLSLAQNSGFTELTNGRADAFRHAFWNARDTADFGKTVTGLFTTAHEYGSTSEAIIVTMDLFNNEQGRNIGENYSITTPDATVQTQITNAVNLGTLKYLNPLGAGGVITPSTTLKWTNL